MKRAFEILCSAIGLLLLAPLFVAIGVAIKLDDGGPIFFRQRRAGKGMREFQLYKFRSMVLDADRAGLLTAGDDARVTRLGRGLRRFKLDELPQLINVLKGDMQLVGPRPEVPRYVAIFRREYEMLLAEPPGITDPASIAYRHEDLLLNTKHLELQYVSEILPRKLRLSLAYQKRRTFFSDISILLRTLPCIPMRHGHFETKEIDGRKEHIAS